MLTTLDRDRGLFIIGEPIEADDQRWYRVALLVTETCEGKCDLIGFVSTPRAGDEGATITEADVDCPASPMADEELATLDPLEALHCYGRNEIVIEGTVENPCCGYVGPFEFSPEWLAHPHTPAFLLAVEFGLGNVPFRAHPETGLLAPGRGDIVRVTGHFEDPAATSCRVTINDEFETEQTPVLPDPARVILNCRATFVWANYEVIGHEDLGPCCGWDPSRSIASAAAPLRRPVSKSA